MLSKKTKYAIKALVALGKNVDQPPMQISKIAEAERTRRGQRGDVGWDAGAERGDRHPRERHRPEERRRAGRDQRKVPAVSSHNGPRARSAGTRSESRSTAPRR